MQTFRTLNFSKSLMFTNPAAWAHGNGRVKRDFSGSFQNYPKIAEYPTAPPELIPWALTAAEYIVPGDFTKLFQFDGLLFGVQAGSPDLLVLDVLNGTPEWQVYASLSRPPASFQSFFDIATDGNSLFLIGMSLSAPDYYFSIYSVSATDGIIEIANSLIPELAGISLSEGCFVYFNNFFYASSLNKILLRISTAGLIELVAPVDTAPYFLSGAVLNDVLYLGADDGTLYSLDTSDDSINLECNNFSPLATNIRKLVAANLTLFGAADNGLLLEMVVSTPKYWALAANLTASATDISYVTSLCHYLKSVYITYVNSNPTALRKVLCYDIATNSVSVDFSATANTITIFSIVKFGTFLFFTWKSGELYNYQKGGSFNNLIASGVGSHDEIAAINATAVIGSTINLKYDITTLQIFPTLASHIVMFSWVYIPETPTDFLSLSDVLGTSVCVLAISSLPDGGNNLFVLGYAANEYFFAVLTSYNSKYTATHIVRIKDTPSIGVHFLFARKAGTALELMVDGLWGGVSGYFTQDQFSIYIGSFEYLSALHSSPNATPPGILSAGFFYGTAAPFTNQQIIGLNTSGPALSMGANSGDQTDLTVTEPTVLEFEDQVLKVSQDVYLKQKFSESVYSIKKAEFIIRKPDNTNITILASILSDLKTAWSRLVAANIDQTGKWYFKFRITLLSGTQKEMQTQFFTVYSDWSPFP